jgi:hypothetical protein
MIFISLPKPSDRTSLEFTQALTEGSTRDRNKHVSWEQSAARARCWQFYRHMWADFLDNLVSSGSHNPHKRLWPIKGIAPTNSITTILLSFIYIYIYIYIYIQFRKSDHNLSHDTPLFYSLSCPLWFKMQDFRLSLRWLWRMPSAGMWRHVVLVWIDVSEERIASVIRVKRITKIGQTLAATNNWSTLP